MAINHKKEVGEIKDHILFENENVKLTLNGWKPRDFKVNEYSQGELTLEIKGITTILILPEWSWDIVNLKIEEKDISNSSETCPKCRKSDRVRFSHKYTGPTKGLGDLMHCFRCKLEFHKE